METKPNKPWSVRGRKPEYVREIRIKCDKYPVSPYREL